MISQGISKQNISIDATFSKIISMVFEKAEFIQRLDSFSKFNFFKGYKINDIITDVKGIFFTQ